MFLTGFRAHGVQAVSAWSTKTAGAPLNLTLTDDQGSLAEITIFTDDQAYTDALIEAINAVNAGREAGAKLLAGLASEAEAA